MFRSPNFPSPLVLMIALAGVVLVAGSCGREAPVFAPGSVTVTSTPPGAAVLLDGRDTGLVTPALLTDLEAGRYVVSVRLEDWETDPPDTTLDVGPLDVLSADFTLSQTGIRVLGQAGARILVDGTDTGRIAPAFVPLAAGQYELSLQAEGFHVFPASVEVAVEDGKIVEMPEDAFVLRSQRTVILEGFANVSCLPCPQLTANLKALAARPEYPADRVTYLEFSVSWPELADPFYLANPAENSERFTLYQVLGAPDLYVDGLRQPDALDAEAMEAAVLAALETDPGFLIDVMADFTTAAVPVTVTLRAPEAVDLSGTTLFVALFEEVVVVEPAPGLNGQTEFHHVFRDRADQVEPPGTIEAGVPTVRTATVNRGSYVPANLVVVAFVQRDSDRVILQGGSTAVEGVP